MRKRGASGRAAGGPRSRGKGKGYYMISAVAESYGIHPQTLRLYEREGLLCPSRTEGNTRLYSDDDLMQLETILNLTRDLGVNLAGVEIILNMREKMERMQTEIGEFVEYVQREMAKQEDGWRERVSNALVKLPPRHLVKKEPSAGPEPPSSGGPGRGGGAPRQ